MSVINCMNVRKTFVFIHQELKYGLIHKYISVVCVKPELIRMRTDGGCTDSHAVQHDVTRMYTDSTRHFRGPEKTYSMWRTVKIVFASRSTSSAWPPCQSVQNLFSLYTVYFPRRLREGHGTLTRIAHGFLPRLGVIFYIPKYLALMQISQPGGQGPHTDVAVRDKDGFGCSCLRVQTAMTNVRGVSDRHVR